ncbi:MAG: hypothetical protein IJM81_08250 [Prevotella sp.]|nr:hypothetical protein [Prevotella sp.]
MNEEKQNELKVTIETTPDTEKAQEKPNAQEPPQEEHALPTLTEVIKEQATEDESPLSKSFTLRKILGGDILTTSTIRRQIWVLVLITVFIIIYITNRYSCQQSLIKIDKLNKELQEAKYRALSISSELTERCRESNVLNVLRQNSDSTLHTANQPPFKIQVPEK